MAVRQTGNSTHSTAIYSAHGLLCQLANREHVLLILEALPCLASARRNARLAIHEQPGLQTVLANGHHKVAEVGLPS